MITKIVKAVAITAIAGGSVLVAAGPAGAAHYCVTNPSGEHQTNGNGNRGGSAGWRNSSTDNPSETGGIQNAEDAGALGDCTTGAPEPNNP